MVDIVDDEFLKSIRTLYERNSPTVAMATFEDMNERLDVVKRGGDLVGKVGGNRRRWTYEEDLRIVDALCVYGPKWRKVAHAAQLGSDDAVRNRVMRMKIYKLPKEVQSMVTKIHEKRRPLYPNGSGNAESNAPPNATPNARPLASPVQRHWTPDEDEMIIKHLKTSPRRSAWQILHETEILCRTKHAIRNRAGRIGLLSG
tara:strand:+ start:1459 stop:2061 length:603 start_codon:yes stop_codon:yes gene_type:complete